MSDRLADLRRQRTLIQEHLAWLDREIAATENPGAPPSAPALPAAPDSPPSLRFGQAPLVNVPLPTAAPRLSAAPKAIFPALPTSAKAGAPAEATLGEYRLSPVAVKQDVRKGCFLYFAVAMLLLVIGVAAMWITWRTFIRGE